MNVSYCFVLILTLIIVFDSTCNGVFMLSYLIICPLVFLAGFIDAIAGGGGLISLPAYMICGFPSINCIATNKMSSCMGTTIATCKYAKNGFIPWKIALFSIPCAFLGSSIGANIALLISDRIFKTIMLVVLPLTGIYVLTKKELSPKEGSLPKGKMILFSMLIAFIIGLYDGFYGPGTGTFLILLLTGIAKMKLDQANGLTKAINFTTNVSALTVFLLNGEVMFPLGIIAGCFNILGNWLGANRFSKSGSKLVKPVMCLVLLIFFIKVIVELIQG